MDIIEIGEPIKVHVIFDSTPCVRDSKGRSFPHHKIKPWSFLWHDREYQIKEITYVWREAIGEAMIYHFTVTQGADVFELGFNASTMEWTLMSVASD